jgi:hypothetical protein
MSWNLSCAVTRTPICHSDKLRFIFLGLNPDLNKNPMGRLHITDDWAPLSFPLAMTYSGDGWVSMRNEEDWAGKMFLDSLSKCVEREEVALRWDNEAPTTIDEATVLLSIDALHFKNQGEFRGVHVESCPAAMMVLHESAYELLTQEIYEASFDEIVASLNKFLSPLADIAINDLPVLRRLPKGPDIRLISYWFDDLHDSLCPRVEGLKAPSPVDVMHDIHAKLHTGFAMDDEDIKERIEAIARMIILQANMKTQGIPFAPTLNAAHDFSAVLQGKIANLTSKLITP